MKKQRHVEYQMSGPVEESVGRQRVDVVTGSWRCEGRGYTTGWDLTFLARVIADCVAAGLPMDTRLQLVSSRHTFGATGNEGFDLRAELPVGGALNTAGPNAEGVAW